MSQNAKYGRKVCGFLYYSGARIGQMKIQDLRLHTTQGHHPEIHPRLILDGRQQLTVNAAEITAEGLTLEWVLVDLQGVALQGHDEDAPAL